jgi:hypothetical protein
MTVFKICLEQLEQLGEESRSRFVRHLADYLAENFPEYVEAMSRLELHAWIDAAVRKAEGYGVTTEPECAQCVLLFLPLGIDADERFEWAGETLRDPELAAIGKVRKLAELAREQAIEGIDDVVVFDFMEL